VGENTKEKESADDDDYDDDDEILLVCWDFLMGVKKR
jgi:hypothetical protein